MLNHGFVSKEGNKYKLTSLGYQKAIDLLNIEVVLEDFYKNFDYENQDQNRISDSHTQHSKKSISPLSSDILKNDILNDNELLNTSLFDQIYTPKLQLKNLTNFDGDSENVKKIFNFKENTF